MSAGAELVQLWSVGRQDLEDVPPTSHVVIVKTLSDVRPHTHTQRPHTAYPPNRSGTSTDFCRVMLAYAVVRCPSVTYERDKSR